MLSVTVVKVEGLASNSWFGSTKPYVLSTLVGTGEENRSVTKEGLNPVYNHNFCFYSLPEGDHIEDTMKFEVYDQEKLSKDDILGTAELKLEDVPTNRPVCFELDLKPSKSAKISLTIFYSTTDVLYDLVSKDTNLKNADFSQFRNLSFEGGGVKGLAYGGVVRVLEECGILENILRVSGTSAGAITALLLGLGVNAEKFKNIMDNTDFSYFPKSTSLAGKFDYAILAREYGWNSAEGFTEVMTKNLLDLLEGVPGYESEESRKDITFAQHHELFLKRKEIGRPFKDLYLVGSNLSRNTCDIFSYEKTPDMPLLVAVRISMSIPLFFTAVKYNNNVFVDGGLRLNYPVNVFDQEKYVENVKYFKVAGNLKMNYETLGLKTDTLLEIFALWSGSNICESIDSFGSYTNALNNFFFGQTSLTDMDKKRTVLVDIADIATTDFALSDVKKNFLTTTGEKWTRAFLSWWSAGCPACQKKFTTKFDPKSVITLDDNDRGDVSLNEDISGVYKITVETSTKGHAGTDAAIAIELVGEHGKSKSAILDNLFYDNFEEGCTDEFTVNMDKYLGELGVIILHNRGGGLSPAWLPEKVTITDAKQNTYVFPVYSWIMENDARIFFEITPRKLHETPEWVKAYRFQDLARANELYQYALYDDLSAPGLQRPTLFDYPRRLKGEDATLPQDEVFSDTKNKDFGKLVLKGLIGSNGLHVDMAIRNFAGGFPWTKFEHIHKVYELLLNKVPTVANRWDTDREFARQMLGGLNPCMITLLTEDKVFGEIGLSDEVVAGLLKSGATLDSELKDRRLFIIDFRVLEGWLNRVNSQDSKYCYPVCAIFYLNEDDVLLPLAISLNKELLYTPNDAKYDWLCAKCYFSCADTGVHQLYSHWTRTHCVTESYVISMRRNLSRCHPIFRLLKPHFRYTLSINAKARGKLISAGGDIERAFFSGQYSMEMSAALYNALWDFSDQNLPTYFKNRGVDDPKVLPNYPYRDDGMLIWNAIEEYVSNYIDLYYKADEEISLDTELKSWYKELRREGHPQKYATFPRLKCKKDLVLVISTMIWIVSGHHAAVNFAQYDYSSYGPNHPANMTQPIEPQRGVMTEEDVVNRLPNPSISALVISVTKTLSSFASAGEEMYIGSDAEVLEKKASDCLLQFKYSLKKVERLIDENNNSRDIQYKYLKPTQVPNSIAV